MVSQYRKLGMTVALSLFAATAAYALHAPAHDAVRPGPYLYEVPASVPALDNVSNGMLNRATGAYATLVNQSAGPFTGGPEAAARGYLSSRGVQFGLVGGGSDLIFDSVQNTPGSSHVRFVQGVQGVPVWRADIVVSLDAAGQYVHAVSSNYDPFLARAGCATTPALSGAEARAAALAALHVEGTPKYLGDPTEMLCIVRDEDLAGSRARLAWRETIALDEPLGDWEVFVDAANGAILRLTDQARYATDGSGYTFDPDPLTTAQVNYGGNYQDNNDGDTPELTAQRVLHTLPELNDPVGGLYYLRGPWVYLDDFESPTIAPPSSADPNAFTYTRSSDNFEPVNAYYHIDATQRYIQSLGFNNIQHGSIHVDAHGLNGQDNSHYIPSTNRIAWGDGGVDDAEDTDVLLHEYGHAIQQSSRPGWGGGQEGAMGEGFGDYWAGSYSASISSFHDTWVFNWDGHNPFWAGRYTNSTLSYSNFNGDIYHDGSIWCGCWWVIRPEVGRIVSDTDILKHHFYMGTSGTAAQAAAYAMQADHDLYQGLHSGSLFYWFVQRGFLTASQFDVPVLTHTALPDTAYTLGPYPVTVTVSSTSAIVAGSVKVRFGTGASFDQEVVLQPTGNPNEYGGSIPGQGGNVDIRYYLIADNTAGWRGASPRGAENLYYQFHVVTDPAGVAPSLASRPVALRMLSANPSSGASELGLDLPRTAAVNLAVYNVDGRMVRTLASGAVPAGSYRYSWDGRDDAGRELPSGLYFARLEAEGKSLTQRMVRIH
jgi:hypothetical protein